MRERNPRPGNAGSANTVYTQMPVPDEGGIVVRYDIMEKYAPRGDSR
jgi:hypothetical protein